MDSPFRWLAAIPQRQEGARIWLASTGRNVLPWKVCRTAGVARGYFATPACPWQPLWGGLSRRIEMRRRPQLAAPRPRRMAFNLEDNCGQIVTRLTNPAASPEPRCA